LSWHFDPNRVTQAAGYLFVQSGRDEMQYLKLLKLLYFADRKSLAESGTPITGDVPVAMDYGPVLSAVYDYIKCNPRKGVHVWSRYFETKGFSLFRKEDPGTGDLSRYDRRILSEVFNEHRDVDGFDMSAASHDFPEWVEAYNGRGTGTKITTENILSSIGMSPARIESIKIEAEKEAKYFTFVEKLDEAHDDSNGRMLSA